MLKQMRESFSHLKWILFLVIFVFVLLVFVDWGGGGAGGSSAVPQGYAARVNGELITLDDFGRALFMLERQYEQAYGQPLTEEMRKTMGLRRQVLQGLVNQKLLLQQAKKLKLTATPEEVRKRILEMPALSPGGQFVGGELYERYITTNLGYRTAAAFEEDLAQDITLSKIDSALINSVIVPPSLAEAEYRRRTESTVIRYVLNPASRWVSAVEVSPQEGESHYRAHTADYAHPGQRQVKYLLADLATIRSRINLTEEQLRQAYEASREDYRTGESVQARHILLRTDQGAPAGQIEQARREAQQLLDRIRAGEDFAALAREHSDDPGSAAQGGDLGWFERGQMVPEFEQAAFSTPAGQLSDVVQSQFGFHIIQILEKRSGGYRSFEQVRLELEQRLVEQRAAETAREQMAQVRARIEEGAKKSENEMRAYANEWVAYNDAGWFGERQPVEGLGRIPELNAWAFGAETGLVGPVMQSSRGPILPHVVGTREAGVTPLEEIRARVEADARLQKATELAQQKLEEASSANGSLEELASGLSLQVQEVTIRPETPISGIPGNARALSDAARRTDVGQQAGPIAIDAGAVIFEVQAQNRFDPEAFDREKPALMESLRRSEAQKLRASLIDRLRQQAEIEINQEVVGPDQSQPAA